MNRAESLIPVVSAALALSGCMMAPTTDDLTFQDLRIENVDEASAVLRFRTDRMARADVEFGLSRSEMTSTADGGAAMRQTHEIALSGLAADTVYYARAVGVDTQGATYMSPMLMFRTDASAPMGTRFLNLRVEEIGATRGVVRFGTSVPTTCEVEWGLSADALTETAVDPDMVEGELALDHRVPLEDLAPDTMIYLRAKAVDAMDQTAYSDVISFRTAMGGPTGGTNVAMMSMGTTVMGVSSNYSNMPNASTWGADNTIDGQMATEWSSNGDGDGAWVMLDFGQMRDVTRFGFRSRQMSDGTSIIQSVRLIFDGVTTMGPFETPDPDQRYEFAIAPTRARTVRVEAVTTTGGNTGAKEIQFFTM